jgi:hypothetical protein
MKPRWHGRIPWIAVYHSAEKHDLNTELVAAIIMTESSGKPKAFRYEHHYKWLYKVSENAKRLQISVDVEEYYQKCSWGPMQVMGAVAREFGFVGGLQDLLDSPLGIEYGCRKLAWCLDKYNGDWNDAAAAYNAGSVRRVKIPDSDSYEYKNQEYVDRVNGFLIDLKGGQQYAL